MINEYFDRSTWHAVFYQMHLCKALNATINMEVRTVCFVVLDLTVKVGDGGGGDVIVIMNESCWERD